MKRLLIFFLFAIPCFANDYELFPPRIPESKEVEVIPPLLMQVNTFCAANLACTVTGAWSLPNVTNLTVSGTGTFTGTLLCKNFEAIRCEDQFAGASPAARVSAAVLDLGSNPGTVLVPANEANTELLGNLTTLPGATQLIWTMNNAGYGATQGTNWLLCDFSGTAVSSPCRNPGGPQAFQIGRTFNNSPANGNQIATLWGRWSGVSANTLGFPLDTLGIIAEIGPGLTQSNGTPAPIIGIDNVISLTGNNSTINSANGVRFYSTDPGGLANAGTGNSITNMYGYFAQGCASCVPAGLTITNWYNGWFEDPVATRVTNSYALWSNGRTVVSDSGNLTPVLFLVNYNASRSTYAFQVNDASVSRMTIGVAQNGRFDVFQHANGATTQLMQRFTDSGPTGLFQQFQTAAGADLFDVAVDGSITQAANISLTGVIKNVAATATMGLTLKKGSGAGNYTNATTSYTVADSTNLCFTVTIPTGWKLGVSASGALATATAAVVAQAALTDNAACSTANAGIIVETAPIQGAAIAVADSFALNWVITGDGAAHNIALQFKTSNAADTASLINSSATITPTIRFELMPSN